MSGFDANRVMQLARVLDQGSEAEKLALLDELDVKDPISSGLLMRAAADGMTGVRRRALERMSEAGIRPVDAHLDRLLEDDDEEVRRLAAELKARPDTLNPLEQLIPQIEQMAGSLGPLGGLLRGMIDSLRSMGEDNERDQLHALARLEADNPAGLLVVQQALQSQHISVRLLGLKKAAQTEGVLVPEELITQFLSDPSLEIREAASAVIRAGKVGVMDEEALRGTVMQSMMRSMLGAAGMSGVGMGGAGGVPGGLDLGALFGSLSGFGDSGEEEDERSFQSEPAPLHAVDGWIYFVGDVRLRDRLQVTLRRQAPGGEAAAAEQLEHHGAPERWAVRPVSNSSGKRPAWADRLVEAGLTVAAEQLAQAEQARTLSQQVWGVAFAEHTGAVPLTLVFHDGLLSRAEWGGPQPGSWSQSDGAAPAGGGGPLALLRAFLDDPTDERLAALEQARPLRRA